MRSSFGRTRTKAVMCVSTHETILSHKTPRVTAGDSSSIVCNLAIERHFAGRRLAIVVCFKE